LLIVGDDQVGLFQASRNLKNVKAVNPRDLTVYDVLRYDSMVILKDQVDKVLELWS